VSRRAPARSRVGERIPARELRVGERVKVGGAVGVVTFILRGSPFVRWIDPHGREGEPLDLGELIVEVVS
jgi:hypothetical protein